MAYRPQKILIVRFSSIGDLVLTSPVIRNLRLNFPDAEIHFLCKSAFSSVLHYHPEIHKIWTISKSIFEVHRLLKIEGFDWMIDLQNNRRSFVLSRLLKVKTNRFKKLNFKKWLLTQFKVNRLPELHIVDRYLSPLKAQGLAIERCPLEYHLSKADQSEAAALLETTPFPFVAIVLGAAHFTKSPPFQLWTEILSRLTLPIVLLGGDKERDIADQLSKNHTTLNLVGKCSLGVSAAIIEKSNHVITPDTGLMHIAAAFHKPIASIWGNTVPEFGMYPYYGNQTIPQYQSKVSLDCRPCSKIGFPTCPKRHFNCMNKQDVKALVEWTSKLSSD